MTTIRRGDIVRVDLGGEGDDDTRGSEMYKTRPAVVIQNDQGNRYSPTTIIAPVTGGRSNYPFHVNLSEATDGLTKDSYVALDQIRTVDISARILGVVGSVDKHDLERINEAIEISLGLR